jgi:hypothetical protein
MSRFENVSNCYAKNASKVMSKGEKDMFCWGRVVEVHKIGDHEIIECIPRKTDSEILDFDAPHEFHVNGASWHCNSLDAAIMGALAYKYDGSNTQAPRLFCKALGINI